MCASYMIPRPFPWPMYCANASHTRAAISMSVSQAWALHSVVADASDGDDDYHHCQHHPNYYHHHRCFSFHSPADPDQNFHYLSLVLWHNIDYQTLHYRMAVNLPNRIVPFPNRDTASVADTRVQFRAKSWKEISVERREMNQKLNNSHTVILRTVKTD